LKREADERHRRLHELQEAETGVVITEVADLLATLTPREREVVLAVASGERPEDLAAQLKTSRANIDQIVSRARRSLRMRRDEGNER
jgi:DNA-binding NarL/FixJ family response regulator